MPFLFKKTLVKANTQKLFSLNKYFLKGGMPSLSAIVVVTLFLNIYFMTTIWSFLYLGGKRYEII